MLRLKNTLKRAFTIVELVIVIAVIAALAAVLIPTFSSVIRSANESVDQQAVRNINTAIAAESKGEKFDNVSEVILAVEDYGYDLNGYTPLISGMQFYWVKSENRVVYADSTTYKVSYPEEYTDLEYSIGNWYSLNGGIELDNSWKDQLSDSNTTVKISSGKQLASLMNEFSNYASKVTTIELTSNIDLMGSSYKFGTTTKALSQTSSDGVTTNLTITSSGSDTYTIYGFRDDSNTVYGSGEFAEKGYGYGFVSCIGSAGNVTIKNVNFSGMVVKDTSDQDNGSAALFSGLLYGNLTLENVKITNCQVESKQKTAAIAGQFQSGSITLKNVDFENTTVTAAYEGAKLIAYIPSGKSQTFTYDNDCDFSGITVLARSDYQSYTEALSTFTTDYNGYETLFAVVNYSAYNGERGNLFTVITQALYLYTTSTNKTATADDNTTTLTYGVTVKYGDTTYYLRNLDTPGDAQINSGVLQNS